MVLIAFELRPFAWTVDRQIYGVFLAFQESPTDLSIAQGAGLEKRLSSEAT